MKKSSKQYVLSGIVFAVALAIFETATHQSVNEDLDAKCSNSPTGWIGIRRRGDRLVSTPLTKVEKVD